MSMMTSVHRGKGRGRRGYIEIISYLPRLIRWIGGAFGVREARSAFLAGNTYNANKSELRRAKPTELGEDAVRPF